MTEHTSDLVGLWIGTVISNMPHSNKASSTTAKRAQLTGMIKVNGTVVQLNIKNSPISLHVMCISFPDTPHTELSLAPANPMFNPYTSVL
jgi:hypothetical protein